MQSLLHEQTELLEESQKMMAAWTRRRQEAMETGFKAFQTMCGCKDASALTAVYGECLANSMSRIAADVNDAREVALRLAQIGHKSATALVQQGADAGPSWQEAKLAEQEAPQTEDAQ